MVWEDSSNRWSCLENWGVGFLDFFLNFVFMGMGSASALEHYFEQLPGRDGSGPSNSSSSTGAASLIASSSNVQKRATHSVCPIPKEEEVIATVNHFATSQQPYCEASNPYCGCAGH